jgi:hypothetical protein
VVAETPKARKAQYAAPLQRNGFAEVGRSIAAPLRGRGGRLAFGFGGYVAFGELGAFAEEELFHLFFHDFLRAGIEWI